MTEIINNIEEKIIHIYELLYSQDCIRSDEYICKHEDYMKDDDAVTRELEKELINLDNLLNNYIGIKKIKLFGHTIRIKKTKVYSKKSALNSRPIDYYIKLYPNDYTREFHCVKSLFDKRLNDMLFHIDRYEYMFNHVCMKSKLEKRGRL